MHLLLWCRGVGGGEQQVTSSRSRDSPGPPPFCSPPRTNLRQCVLWKALCWLPALTSARCLSSARALPKLLPVHLPPGRLSLLWPQLLPYNICLLQCFRVAVTGSVAVVSGFDGRVVFLGDLVPVSRWAARQGPEEAPSKSGCCSRVAPYIYIEKKNRSTNL